MEKNYYCEGKKTAYFIVNLILSLICFVGCIVALVLSGTDSFSTLIVFDMIIIVCAVVAMFFPGKVAFGLYILGTVVSFIAFCVIVQYRWRSRLFLYAKYLPRSISLRGKRKLRKCFLHHV